MTSGTTPASDISRDYAKTLEINDDGSVQVTSQWTIKNVSTKQLDLNSAGFYCYTRLEHSNIADVSATVGGATSEVQKIAAGPGLELRVKTQKVLNPREELNVRIEYACDADSAVRIIGEFNLLVFHEDFALGAGRHPVVSVAEPMSFTVTILWPKPRLPSTVDVRSFPTPRSQFVRPSRMRRGRLRTTWAFTLTQGESKKTIVALGRIGISQRRLAILTTIGGVSATALVQFFWSKLLGL